VLRLAPTVRVPLFYYFVFVSCVSKSDFTHSITVSAAVANAHTGIRFLAAIWYMGLKPINTLAQNKGDGFARMVFYWYSFNVVYVFGVFAAARPALDNFCFHDHPTSWLVISNSVLILITTANDSILYYTILISYLY